MGDVWRLLEDGTMNSTFLGLQLFGLDLLLPLFIRKLTFRIHLLVGVFSHGNLPADTCLDSRRILDSVGGQDLHKVGQPNYQNVSITFADRTGAAAGTFWCVWRNKAHPDSIAFVLQLSLARLFPPLLGFLYETSV